jgi:two-component system, response regulator PdtaR
MGDAAYPSALVVDDEEFLRLYAAGLLEEHRFKSHSSRECRSGAEGARSRDDVRLLFSDIQMPGTLNGMDLAREVHARWPNVLLAIASGQTKPSRAEVPGGGRFVCKPSWQPSFSMSSTT